MNIHKLDTQGVVRHFNIHSAFYEFSDYNIDLVDMLHR
jgi:hypothetical protein